MSLFFLSPAFLAGSAVAAVPIVLHLLKRQPEATVRFAPFAMLRQAPADQAAHRRLRGWLLLALRVAALWLLALAFARPYLAAGTDRQASAATIVALDTSMSLSAPGQFDRARQLARDAIGRVPSGELVGVLTFDDTAREGARPSVDHTLALAAIAAARPGFGATRYRAALEEAVEMLATAGARRSRIVMVTDLQESGWDVGDRVGIPSSSRIEVADVGAPPSNLAIEAARQSGDRLIATVRNAGPQVREVRVGVVTGPELPRAGERPTGPPASTATLSLAANQSADVTLPVPLGRWAGVFVDDSQGIQGDNWRYLSLGTGPRPPVLVVTSSGDLSRDAFYFEQALTAGSNGAFAVEGIKAAGLAAWDGTSLGDPAVVVLLSTQGLERRGRAELANYLRNGGGLLVAAGPDLDGALLSEAFGDRGLLTIGPSVEEPGETRRARALVPADIRHPVFLPFGADAASLLLVSFRRIALLQTSGCDLLARFTSGEPALVDCQAGPGRILAFASDLDNHWNDFPLRATFVPFITEAIRYLVASRPPPPAYVVGHVPPGLPQEPGVLPIPGGADVRLATVNVNPDESDPSRLSAEEFQTAVTRSMDADRPAVSREARQQADHEHSWQYLLVGVVAVLAGESVVARRAV